MPSSDVEEPECGRDGVQNSWSGVRAAAVKAYLFQQTKVTSQRVPRVLEGCWLIAFTFVVVSWLVL